MREAEPEIPSAMDDWDLEFERLTGALPPFSNLRRKAMIQLQSKMLYRHPSEPMRLPGPFDSVVWTAVADAIWTADLD